jgi:chemotaxis protein methyltransferase CheR
MNMMAPPFGLSLDQCHFIAERVLNTSGVNVDPQKKEFIHLRVSRRLNALDLASFDEYIDLLKADGSGVETRRLVEALTTHTTSFFRERHQYDWLAGEGLSRICANGAGFERPLTVWSAACSIGAELWTAGMVLADAARQPLGPRKFELIGTDISTPILKKAKSATYSEVEVEGVGEEHCTRYLMRSRQKLGSGKSSFFRVVPELREKASFEFANLSRLAGLRSFSADVIFLRNVLIYFDAEMQERVLNDVIGRLRPGGVLFTGHAEAVAPRKTLEVLAPSTYQKVS